MNYAIPIPNPVSDLDARHVRMARSGLNLTVRDLAEISNVNKATIVRIEAGMPVRHSTLLAVKQALEARGALFYECDVSKKILVSV